MSEINIKIDVFEGPLDLLLHLIQHLEVDIYDIPIAEITSQYLAYIQTMKILELDVAGDYLVMAATLMAIKSDMLLPKPELTEAEEFYEEGIDPRDALIDQLLEYKQYKQAASVLKSKEEERSQYFTKDPSNLEEYQEDIELEPEKVSVIDLVLAFQEMLSKKKLKEPVQTKIVSDDITMEDKMQTIMTKIQSVSRQTPVLFSELFETVNRNEVVVTFLALLELMKQKEIDIKQEKAFDEIVLFSVMEENVGESIHG